MLIFLYGKNALLSREKLRELKRSFLEKNPAGEGLAEFELEAKGLLTVPEFISSLGEQSLFSGRRCIIAKNFLANGNKETGEKIIRALDRSVSDNVVIFWEEGEKYKGELFDFLLAKAKCQRFDPLGPAQIRRWITEEAKKTNPEIQLSPAVLGLLGELARTEDITQEIRKIVTYKVSGIVELAEAENLLASRFTSRIFETVDALLSGKRGLAMDKLQLELASGADEYYLFSMYAYQLRNLLKISGAWEGGLRNSRDIARETGLNPFVIDKNLNQVRRKSLTDIKQLFSRLAELDGQVKTGQIQITLALNLLVAGA